MRILAAPGFALVLLPALACSKSPSPGPSGAPDSLGSASAGALPAASASPLASWSRGAFSPVSTGNRSFDPPLFASSDPRALDDLVAAAPKPERRPTAVDGGTAIGSDTGVLAQTTEAAPAPPEPRRTPKVVVGTPTVQPAMPNPAIERASRAQLYWNLVQRCRDPQGNILPPDAIRLQFKFDVDGFIIPSSIIATAEDPRFKSAAHCMQRQLSTSAFQAPAASRGTEGSVNATVPSVD